VTYQKSRTDKIVDVVLYIIYALFALVCIFPFYYVIINTVSDNTLVDRGRILFLPEGLHIRNYLQIFKLPGIYNATFISVARTVLGTFLTVLSSSFLGYAMTKNELWMRRFWYRFIIVTMYFGAGLIPYFMTIRTLGLMNSFWVYVIPGMVGPFNVVLVKTYIESIPTSLEESAEIDGAGYLKRYFHLILPLAKPILATVAIFTAVGHWNAFMDTVIYANRPNLYSLQFILNRYLNELQALTELIKRSPELAGEIVGQTLTPRAIRFTVTVVVVAPILFVYPFFQRFFVKGIMIGAVKG
jgi:ABC-type glycerol-3-phosphate transport system permease component